MGGKSSTISTEEPRLGNLRVQTSMYGLAQPMVWGQARLTGNLLWFGNFQAIATTTQTSQGGKGGGGVTQVDTKYSYKAAAVLGIARGPIVGIASAWKGKRRVTATYNTTTTTLQSQDLTISPGNSTITLANSGTYLTTVSVTQRSYGSYDGTGN